MDGPVVAERDHLVVDHLGREPLDPLVGGIDVLDLSDEEVGAYVEEVEYKAAGR